MQPYSTRLALHLLRFNGLVLLRPPDQNTRTPVLQILFPLRACKLDPLLLRAVWSICVGKHNFLGKHPGAGVLTTKHKLGECL
jgi:hypothetical protein